MADPAAPLLAWGFDPIFFGAQRMTASTSTAYRGHARWSSCMRATT